MKRLRAILCALLAGALLAGCGVQPRTDDKQGGGAAVDLTKYAVKEAAFPAYPREPRYEDYFNDNGEGDWDAYMAAEDEYMAAMQKLGKGRCWTLPTERQGRSSPTARTGCTRPSACTPPWPC